MPTTRHFSITVLSIVTLSAAGCRGNDTPPPPPATTASPVSAPATERVVGPLTPADAQALATMNDRLRDYVELHQRIEAALPKLPKDATPEQLDQSQRRFEKKMREARATAKQGDLFTPEATPVIKRLLVSVFEGPDGKQLKSSIMDENTVNASSLKLRVNSRYPDSVPLTSVPPQVLQTLPELAEDLEYRFVGHWMVLFDSHAHIVADYIPDAIPN
ncbi:MAG: hypothetical protein ABI051_03100 [Vicinamibacterales bacterium]